MGTIAALGSLPSSFTDELKIPYRKYLRKGLIFSIIIHIFAVAAYGGGYYYSKYKQEQEQKQFSLSIALM